ncbi:DnaJ family domain-containing protein [Microbacterium lacusdiani]
MGDRPDPRQEAARYLAERDLPPEQRGQSEERTPTWSTPEERAAVVEQAIQQAIRRGDFDDLPGAGKPLTGLGTSHDPDWWIRQKIERENLRGLAPPALALRVEDAELTEWLDGMHRESDVRETLEDFNRRVKYARLQLLGGPPVVTALRDVDAEVAAWHERREARAGAAREAAARAEAEAPRRRGFWRRRAR